MSTFSGINPAAGLRRTIRNAGRAQQIIAVAVRFGFDESVQDLGLDQLYARGKKLLGLQKADAQVLRLPQPVRLRKALEHLGPTFVKIGQILSTRPDLIPPAWAAEFKLLQDKVPPVPFDKLKAVIDAAFPAGADTVFRHIDPEPLAAGSMAQVHRATLVDGTDVVIKVLRPGIRGLVESDMEILALLAQFVEHHFQDQPYSPTEVVAEFSRELQREIDLREEARATDRIRRDFQDDPNIVIPKVYRKATTGTVLALEKINGLPLSQYVPGDLAQEDLEAVVRHGTDAVFRQTLVTGFFHADPHPGNLFALPGGKIAFIDFGMTGHIEPATATALAELVQGVVGGQLDRVIDVVITLSDADPAVARHRQFRADVWDFIARFENIQLAELNMAALLQDFFDRVREHGLRVPADLVFLIKALTTIQGVGEALLPEFDFVGHVTPYVERLIRDRYGPKAISRRLIHSTNNYFKLMEDVPTHIRSLLFDFKRSRVTVNLEHKNLDKLISTVEHASGNIATSLVVGALILGSAIVVLTANLAPSTHSTIGLNILAVIGFLSGITIALVRVVSTWFRR